MRSKFFLGFSRVVVIIIVATIILGSVAGIYIWRRSESAKNPPTNNPSTSQNPTEPQQTISFVLSKTFPTISETTPSNSDVTPQIPSYNLPLKPSDISNYEKFLNKIPLTDNAKKILLKNGFVVIDTPADIANKEVPSYFTSGENLSAKDDFLPYYIALQDKDIPVLITTDVVLHYYHVLFDLMLMRMEDKLFYDYIWDISKQLFDDSIKEYNSTTSEDLKEATKRNIAYLSVALELLKPKDNQIISDEELKRLYCDSYMKDTECAEIIKQIKESGNYQGFTEDDVKKYSFTTPNFVKDIVKQELNLIEKHQGWEYSPIFIYKEDYSQYVPRGHYTNSEKLKNYFKALMWFGRMTALINGSDSIEPGKSVCGGHDGIISKYDSKIQTLQANLITYNFLLNSDIQNKWSRMYEITSFMVGFSDDLGPVEYAQVLKDVLGNDITPEKIEQNLPKIIEKLQNLPYNPKIYSGLGECELVMPCPPLTDAQVQELKTQAKELLNETKGFRMIGQKFTLDSWLFSEIVSPYSGEYTGEKTPLPTKNLPFTFTWNDGYKHTRPFTWVKTNVEGCGSGREVRGFPTGLDLMALLGSDRAKEILKQYGDTNYSDYEKKFDELKKTVDSLTKDDWSKNIYMNWLYALKGLITPYGKGYQTFMQTDAWKDKELNTALASWAELRHDTILYVKQSYGMAEKGEGEEIPLEPYPGYVEPTLEFYSRLLTLTKLTNEGLTKILPQEDMQKVYVNDSLDVLYNLVQRLQEITKKELQNKQLEPYEYDFIKHFSDSLDGLLKRAFMGQRMDSKVLKTSMIADVHTDGNTKMALEEGTGFIKTIIIAFKVPDGRVVLGAGPVMSYYEFKQLMSNRLTDEEWRNMLNGKHPDTPPWTKSFYAGN